MNSLSIVVPIYNEIENLNPLYDRLTAALEPLGRDYEILLIDDGSTDGSAEALRVLAERDRRVRVVRFRRNYGQTAAMQAGLEMAEGDIVVTLDGDLQNDPADIPAMLRMLDDCDAVCGVRVKRLDSFSKRISSKAANKFRAMMLGDRVTDAGCAFRAMKRRALCQLPGFKALHRFAPTILKLHGFRVAEMPINHRPRTFGKSKYGIGNRLGVGLADVAGMLWYRKRFFPPDRVLPEEPEALQKP